MDDNRRWCLLFRMIKEGVLLWRSNIYAEVLRMRRASYGNGHGARRRKAEGLVCVYVCARTCAKVWGRKELSQAEHKHS